MGQAVLLAARRGDGSEQLRRALASLELAVTHVSSGTEALARHERLRPDLVVVEFDLPDVHGLDLCRRLRSDSDVPVVVIGDDPPETERVLALELGADDVIGRGCSPDEFRARVRAVLARGRRGRRPAPRPQVLEFGDIVIDRRAHLLSVGRRREQLTPMETELLWALAQRAGEVVTARELLRDVWGYPPGVQTRTLDVHVGRLRRKLGENGHRPRIIVTVRSVGYRFDPPCR